MTFLPAVAGVRTAPSRSPMKFFPRTLVVVSLALTTSLAVASAAFAAGPKQPRNVEATSDVAASPAVESSPEATFDVEKATEKALLDSRLPWYGPQGLQRIEPQERREVQSTSTASGGSEFLGWLFLFGSFVVLSAAAYFILREWGGGASAAPTSAARETSRVIDRVEELPLGLAVDPNLDFLAETRKAAGAGDFSRAVVYLYGWQLLELDRGHVLRLVKGKTNRQYLREASATAGPELGAVLQATIDAFESVYFGGRAMPRELFDLLWNRIPEFQRLAVRRAPA